MVRPPLPVDVVALGWPGVRLVASGLTQAGSFVFSRVVGCARRSRVGVEVVAGRKAGRASGTALRLAALRAGTLVEGAGLAAALAGEPKAVRRVLAAAVLVAGITAA